jgi:hypothetical protein
LSGDVGLVEVSLNNGTDWTELGQFTNGSQLDWRRERFALPSAATNSAIVLVRFRITTDTANQADGWWLDDIAVSESPAMIDAASLDGGAVPQHETDLEQRRDPRLLALCHPSLDNGGRVVPEQSGRQSRRSDCAGTD